MPRCTVRSCRVPVRRDFHYICEFHWEDLCEKVHRVIDRASIAYIGRSRHPWNRINDHEEERGLDECAVVHTAWSADEAMAIEEALIRRFMRLERWKLDNISDESDGSIREGRNYIYVAYAR